VTCTNNSTITNYSCHIHAQIEREDRPQFLIGKYELGVFAAMKAVEVRVRQLSGFPSHLIGVDLMNQAFGPKGPLTDSVMAKGEQEGTRAFSAGAYGILRKPSRHREVNYDDVSEAAVRCALRRVPQVHMSHLFQPALTILVHAACMVDRYFCHMSMAKSKTWPLTP
jgi:uncharacterized protein (TIGR02391 family)